MVDIEVFRETTKEEQQIQYPIWEECDVCSDPAMVASVLVSTIVHSGRMESMQTLLFLPQLVRKI